MLKESIKCLWCELEALQSRKPLPGILNLEEARISAFPEIEEFLVILDGFGFVVLLLTLVQDQERKL